MSMQQGNTFGRRGGPRVYASEHPASPEPKPPVSPRLKQIGGIALGVVIAFAIGAVFVGVMKQAGRGLGDRFLENAAAGSPQGAINRVAGGDAALQVIRDVCKSKAKAVDLNVAQKRATDGYMQLLSGESELASAAAYVECLAKSQPARFCQKPDKAHLAEAVRQYFKLMMQVREEWALQLGGPGLQKAALMGTPYRQDQRAALGLPSALTSPSMLAALRGLVGEGYMSVNDFGTFAGFGVPRDVSDAMRGVESKKAACA